MNTNTIRYLDGAMGTELQKAGLQPGRCPEALNITDPSVVRAIHRSYIEAGSDIIYSNTFGGNRYKVRSSGYSAPELIAAGIRCAREAVMEAAASGTIASENAVKVALDIGPIGKMMEPAGDMTLEEAYDIFREMIQAGESAGADLVVFETMTDLYEVKAGVLAAKECSSLPVFTTMSYEANGRTFTGCSISAMAAVLDGLGVDAMGINCSLGPDEIYPMARELCSLTDKAVIVKPNAGLPDPATGEYRVDAHQFARSMQRFAELGVRYMGGCCGTAPEYIRALRQQTQNLIPASHTPRSRTVVCTPTRVVEADGVRVIGERINPTGKKKFRQAILDGDMDYIVRQAVDQADAGAHILDINVGVPGVNEAEVIVKVIRAVQAVTDLPLQLDSSSPAALEAGLRVVNGKAIINSVNGEQEKLDLILPLAKKYGAAVVGLAMDENGIPPSAEQRFSIAERILNEALKYGMAKEDVLIDCLTLTVSAEQDKATETLKAMAMVRDRLGLHCVLGVSNISFGLPHRELITSGFLTLAMANGLDFPIVNPNSESIMDTIRVFNVLYNRDKNAEEYIAACAKKPAASTAPAASGSAPAAAPSSSAGPDADLPPLERAVVRGLKEECRSLTGELLKDGLPEIDIINTLLIPALDVVGDRYEHGRVFLPQLIQSANAATEAFDILKASIAAKGSGTVSKGKLIIATVKGDIHDIGKNIVKTILENYGYTVLDLGRDVAPEAVVRTAIEQDVHLVGLSALMTTTLPAMSETVRALRTSGHPCKIWVGGAVLTEEYAKEIGADYYAKDAKESVDIAKEVLG